MSENDIIQTMKNTLKHIDDISPDSKNDQLARMRQDRDYWNEKFLEEERRRQQQSKHSLHHRESFH